MKIGIIALQKYLKALSSRGVLLSEKEIEEIARGELRIYVRGRCEVIKEKI